MQQPSGIAKISTGIEGLDEVTGGGFPQGRPILICGSAGCGKTLFGIQFLVKGILENDEPGVFVSFEETATDLTYNSASLGFDLKKLTAEGKLRIDHIRVERSEIEETGEYDLEGLFIRLNYAIDAIGAKRVVLDTIESLFSGMQNEGLLRSEIRRLFAWLKEKGVTTVITGERGTTTLTRQGLEEYVSDCVILLDFRVVDQIATRRLRIVKYRGSTHGTNEYPFLIDENGISVIPITSLKLDYGTSSDVISTGLPPLDTLFKKNGIYEGSSTLITGTAGTAKTILAGYFALGSCLRNERVLIFSFEEAPDQTIRNLLTIGVDLRPFIKSKLLLIHASRPTLHGLEMHLLVVNKLLKEFRPKTVIVDPISSLVSAGSPIEVKAMLVRLIDTLKIRRINALFTCLMNHTSSMGDGTIEAVSSLADNWLYLQNDLTSGKRQRSLLIVKARGMEHYNDWVNFTISPTGVRFAASSTPTISNTTNGK
ncbi:circadian clock protein KaiC [Puia sp. P3]|uniref:circadian clock protein KaiC n=1 Tax=Puia sp. P3 TaxID=3423952 RepID=UPI003D67754D